MNNITKLILPDDVLEDMTTYAEKIIATPGRYITADITSELDDFDVNDPRVPGINDDFVLVNKDLNTVQWNDSSLHMGIFNKLFHIAYPPMDLSKRVMTALENTTGLVMNQPRGNFLYPKGGYMGWHTNSDVPGLRVYMVYSPEEKSSYFKYVDRTDPDQPKIITDWDDKGWTIRAFYPSGLPMNYLWHCVAAIDAPRISFGYLLK